MWLLEQGLNLQALRHLINSQARLPIPPSRNELVERAGIEPASPACKAGALPIELSSHRAFSGKACPGLDPGCETVCRRKCEQRKEVGAWGRFRAHLSAFSARRFHQIS